MADEESTEPTPTYEEPITVALRKPIKYGTRQVTELTLRPVKAKYMRALKTTDSQYDQTLQIAATISGEVKEVIDELEGKDLAEVLEVTNGFLLVTRSIGRVR